ncbi:MAG: tetratricopeptide repeat protein [Candidatus Gracilibacteria bacterium]|nr:tetratricopeptide repeat protein [Candidatus Gracilibacteria bacterium]MDD3120084.1 tetratricopeptide repeat protein [Candidatus Gracilibacteria bacterium]MDD4530206.1 tetratricopeptide repeat protein [Candidatus Gracilibacteria bacterium]
MQDVNYIMEIENLKNAGKYKEAVAKTQEYLIKYTDDYRLYEELADIYIFTGNIKKAKSAAESALKLNKESATGNYLLGYIYVTDGEFEKGIEHLEKSNNLFPNNPEVLRNLGWGYNMLGQRKKGIMILKRALNIAPDDKFIMEDLGVALSADGSFEEGAVYLKQAGRDDRIIEFEKFAK